MGIFDKRISFKPFEYPEIMEYKKAINHSFWLAETDWNFISDIDDFKVRLDDVERHIIKNTLLAISQIEVSVKKFWTKLGERFPKAEFEQVGVTFGENEVRHADAYSHLLQILGLNDDFTQLMQVPVIQQRVDYLTKYLKGASDNSNENYTLTLTLFSIFIENVSLFSQFVIIKSFNKYRNILKDIDNVVQATQKEECYIEDTEILTPNGWRLLSELKVGDDVYQYENGNITPTCVLHKTEKYYKGKVFQIGNKSSDCVVTPKHDMVYYNQIGELKKTHAEDIKYHSRIRVPAGGILYQNGDVGLTWEDRLRIAIQADATNLYWINSNDEKCLRGYDGGYTHSFGLTKIRKQQRLRLILSNLPYEYVEVPDEKQIIFKIRYNHQYDYKNMSWVNFKDKNSLWCQDFVKECMQWDGYYQATNKGYSTTNKICADIVHAAAVLGGFRSNVLINKDKRGYKDTYKISISYRSLLPSGYGYSKISRDYSGKVYCVTVPSGIIITRLNGKVCIAGNCIHALFGMKIINIIKEEFPHWFNEDFYEKLYRACKKAYMAESDIIDWIFEKGELSFLSKDVIKEYVKFRFNESLVQIGGKEVFELDQVKIDQLKWFEEEIYLNTVADFFAKRPIAYSKKMQSIKAEDLF